MVPWAFEEIAAIKAWGVIELESDKTAKEKRRFGASLVPILPRVVWLRKPLSRSLFLSRWWRSPTWGLYSVSHWWLLCDTFARGSINQSDTLQVSPWSHSISRVFVGSKDQARKEWRPLVWCIWAQLFSDQKCNVTPPTIVIFLKSIIRNKRKINRMSKSSNWLLSAYFVCVWRLDVGDLSLRLTNRCLRIKEQRNQKISYETFLIWFSALLPMRTTFRISAPLRICSY